MVFISVLVCWGGCQSLTCVLILSIIILYCSVPIIVTSFCKGWWPPFSLHVSPHTTAFWCSSILTLFPCYSCIGWNTCCPCLCSRKCLVHAEIFLKVWTASENSESGMRTNYSYGWFNIPTRLQSTKDT